jgi:hypothetical protein
VWHTFKVEDDSRKDYSGSLVKEEKALPSILQDYWDSKLKDTHIFLFIMGSSISMMERLMGYKSPLYGRWKQ